LKQNFFKKQLVLIGGGHANVQVLRKLCMNEYRDLHVVLINDNFRTIYSGMTPGFIQGSFSLEDISIDLQRLCLNAGAVFIKDHVYKLDRKNKTVLLKKHPAILYDILSINTGSISKINDTGFKKNPSLISVKPISHLVQKINYIDKKIKNSKNKKINIIGGGVAAFEISFALFNRYKGDISLSIISKKKLLEKNLNHSSKKKLIKIANDMNIKMIANDVEHIQESRIILDNNKNLYGDIFLFSSGASLPQWLKDSNLKLINDFIGVNNCLQSLSDENIFVTGDAANIQGYQRAKSGVMAVRQGEVLKENIFLKFKNKPLKIFKPQNNWLYLIGTYKNSALLNFYNFSLQGTMQWKLKKIIDQNFLKKFSFSNKISMKKNLNYLDNLNKDADEMFCQGCGSKVSKKSLVKFLSKDDSNKELSDSSLLETNRSHILQTIDHIKLFRSFDPYDFGIISYQHSQNDILSSGGVEKSLSVSVGVPFSENFVENFYLEYFMKGIKSESNKNGSLIAAGHSYQSQEPGITITMNGLLKYKSKKSYAKKDDLIYLSKPLGSGYLLAAYNKNSHLINIKNFEELLIYLKKSNKMAAEVAMLNFSQVLTDISGFGLASHLGDICKNSNLSAQISLKEEILINNNINILQKYQSTGFKNNYLANLNLLEINQKHPLFNILFDPQTNGPLLIAINPNKKDKFERDFKKTYKQKPILLGQFIEKKEKLIFIN